MPTVLPWPAGDRCSLQFRSGMHGRAAGKGEHTKVKALTFRKICPAVPPGGPPILEMVLCFLSCRSTRLWAATKVVRARDGGKQKSFLPNLGNLFPLTVISLIDLTKSRIQIDIQSRHVTV